MHFTNNIVAQVTSAYDLATYCTKNGTSKHHSTCQKFRIEVTREREK